MNIMSIVDHCLFSGVCLRSLIVTVNPLALVFEVWICTTACGMTDKMSSVMSLVHIGMSYTCIFLFMPFTMRPPLSFVLHIVCTSCTTSSIVFLWWGLLLIYNDCFCNAKKGAWRGAFHTPFSMNVPR